MLGVFVLSVVSVWVCMYVCVCFVCVFSVCVLSVCAYCVCALCVCMHVYIYICLVFSA